MNINSIEFLNLNFVIFPVKSDLNNINFIESSYYMISVFIEQYHKQKLALYEKLDLISKFLKLKVSLLKILFYVLDDLSKI